MLTAFSKIFNPDLAVIGNFVGVAGGRHQDPRPALELREAETSLQAIVDPYARADFFFGFSPEGVEIEEGYLTFPTLPAAGADPAEPQRTDSTGRERLSRCIVDRKGARHADRADHARWAMCTHSEIRTTGSILRTGAASLARSPTA
jgi:hypothetical protein